jgi:hypothetical protein
MRILNFENFIFESSIEIENDNTPFAELAAAIKQNLSTIKVNTAQELEEEDVQNVIKASTGSSEALITFALGAALSAGKLTSIVGKSLQYLNKKIGATDNVAITNVSNWLVKKGDAYSHKIEEFIVKLLEITPATKILMKSLNPKQKQLLGKVILTSLLIFLGIEAGKGIIHSFASGDNFFAAIESILVGTKSAEIAETIPHIIRGVIAGTAETVV